MRRALHSRRAGLKSSREYMLELSQCLLSAALHAASVLKGLAKAQHPAAAANPHLTALARSLERGGSSGISRVARHGVLIF